MSDPKTISIYDAQATEYAELTKADAIDKQLLAFIGDIPAGGHVLDLGCGPGHCAATMADHGLKVTASDASLEMISLASRHPNVTTLHVTFDDISGVNLYDGIWANFSLLHAPRADMPRYLASLAQALKPGGRFHIGMKLGQGEQRDKIGRRYTYYSEDELVRLVTNSALNVTNRTFGSGIGLDGSTSDWISLTAHG